MGGVGYRFSQGWAAAAALLMAAAPAASAMGVAGFAGRMPESPAPRHGAAVAADVPLSDGAYALLNERVSANANQFYVYQDVDSGFNHAFASGVFASGGNWGSIRLDAACIDDPSAASGCSSDPERLDRQRGTVLRITFDPQGSGRFAGVNIEEPENWGARQTGSGYDLRGVSRLLFDTRSPSPGGITVKFAVKGQEAGPFHVPQSASYTPMVITMGTFGLSDGDLSNVHRLFTVVTNDLYAPNGGVLLLDNIRFDPPPVTQQTAPSFPLSTETFGVRPRSDVSTGRVPIPPDQANRNITAAYESAITMLALLQRGSPADLASARRLADAFSYSLSHDNSGDRLPAAPDGAAGLHSGYETGDLALRNDQIAGGKAGEIRLAGFTAGAGLCGPTQYCLALDGATGGNNAFAILALAAAYRQFGEQRYLDDALAVGRWIRQLLADGSASGYGGFFLGYPDGTAAPKPLETGKSTENNADIFAAFAALAGLERRRGNDGEADAWTLQANRAGDFVMEMFDAASGCFSAGTVPVGTPPSPGIDPSGPQRGNDVINVAQLLDADTFPVLAMAGAPRYRGQIDWRRPVDCAANRFAQTVTAAGETYRGVNIAVSPVAGPYGVAWEFTGQVAVAQRLVGRLAQEAGRTTAADAIVSELRHARGAAPFGDGRGVVAATMQNGDLLLPSEQCLSTPFQCIPERVGLAATVWAVFAERDINPLGREAVFAVAPARGTSGSPFGRQPQVRLLESGITDLSNSSAAITLRLQPGAGAAGASLTCDQTQPGGTSITAVNGVAAFTGCAINLPGQGYRLVVPAAGLADAVSDPFDVIWPGDADGSCRVSSVDFSLVVTHYGKDESSPEWRNPAQLASRADLDGDGRVGTLDHSLMVSHFGTACPPP